MYACVLYFCICTCSAQLSMFHMERRSRNTLIIISIIIVTTTIIIIITFTPYLPHPPKETGGGGGGLGQCIKKKKIKTCLRLATGATNFLAYTSLYHWSQVEYRVTRDLQFPRLQLASLAYMFFTSLANLLLTRS